MATLALTEVLAALSLATDLGTGFAPGKGVRTSLVALAVGRQAGLGADDLADAFQAALLASLGCTAYAAENAALFGDDLAFQRDLHGLDVTDPGSLGRFGSWAGEAQAAALRERFAHLAPVLGPAATRACCEASQALGAQLRLRPGAVAAIDHIHERWDGRGIPGAFAGERLPVAARVMHLAEQAVIAHDRAGPAASVAALRARSGGHLDPGLVELVLRDPEPLVAALASEDAYADAIASEPPPKARVPVSDADTLATAFADLADLKSRFTAGHSRAVAALADRAAGLMGYPDEARERARRAALVHDIGRTSVSTAVWERPGALSAGDSDQVRLHPYWSERVLARTSALGELAADAGRHHERLDGSGYHRGSDASGLSGIARLLAAADVMQALQEARPHRPAHSRDDAARILSEEAAAGRLDADAAAAVAEAAGARRPAVERPAGLTQREVEVLRLAARGLSRQEIATELYLSPRTVQHHLSHIYDKTGRRTRAGAALFAAEHGLLEPDVVSSAV